MLLLCRVWLGEHVHAHHVCSPQHVCLCVAAACHLCIFAVQVADTAKAVAEQCDITVAMLADPEAAEAVATGPDGIAAGMSSGEFCLQGLLMLWSAYGRSCADSLWF